MSQIVFLDSNTIGPSVELTKPGFAHTWKSYEQTQKDQLIEHAAGAEIIITNKVPIDREAIEALPDLKCICVAATGYNIIDIEACREHDIIVCNVAGYANTTVPEHAMSMILMLKRSMMGHRQDVLDGKWHEAEQFCLFNHPIEDLSDLTLGIIGRGLLGQGLARLASGFAMNVIYSGRKGERNLHLPYIPFDEFLAVTDIISIHCPLTDETENLISEQEFHQMEKRPVIINTSRGGIVNESDAVAALKAGRISGLGFDVLTEEPPRGDNPLLEIAHYPNVIITPHVAWSSHSAMTNLWHKVIDNIENFKKGTPTNQGELNNIHGTSWSI